MQDAFLLAGFCFMCALMVLVIVYGIGMVIGLLSMLA